MDFSIDFDAVAFNAVTQIKPISSLTFQVKPLGDTANDKVTIEEFICANDAQHGQYRKDFICRLGDCHTVGLRFN